MRPAHSFSFVLLTPFVTLVAWLCLGVMVFVFRLWSPFAWVGLKFRPPGPVVKFRPTPLLPVTHTLS
jgi:hypothetical protein